MAVANQKKSDPEKQLELMEHLAELRSRIIRMGVYISLGMVFGWVFYDFFFNLFATPVTMFLEQSGTSFLLTGVAEGFMIKVQISLLIGIIIAMPFITMEGWGFISPGLTAVERRAVKLVAPLSTLLFVGGVVLAFFAMPIGIRWLLAQNPPEAVFMPSVGQTLLFILKMYLAFGLMFQMPVVLMFLARVGIITSRMLISYWRHSLVAIAIAAAVVTPSGDAFTMMTICVPMFVLYLLSIGLVKLVEKKK